MATALLFPGQGSQAKGMGADLFEQFPSLVERVDAELGYSIRELCERDPRAELGQTQYTQVALYVVNALSYFKWLRTHGAPPDFVAGHSLGEYNALLAAEAFDFMTGLRLVRRRGQLMAQATGGTMSAVIGLSAERVLETLARCEATQIDVANFNSPTQVVVSGRADEMPGVSKALSAAGAELVIPLKVSGAFHSRMMRAAEQAYAGYIETASLRTPHIPVLSNYTGDFYDSGQVSRNLSRQLSSPVRWLDCMRRLLARGDVLFQELGPGNVLTRLLEKIRAS